MLRDVVRLHKNPKAAMVTEKRMKVMIEINGK